MAKRLAIPSKEVALRIIGARDYFTASRIQNTSIDTDIPTTDIDELGNPQHVGTVKDLPTISLTFSAFDVGIKIISALSGTDPTSYPAGGVDVSQLAEIDVIYYIKDTNVAEYVKALHAKRLQIESFTYSYSVDGEATEDYTAAGSEKRWFKNTVITQKETTGGPTTFSGVLTYVPAQLRNNNYLLSVIVDGDYLEEGSSVTAGFYVVSGPTNQSIVLHADDTMDNQILFVYQTASGGDTWTDVSDSIMPPAIRGKNIPIYIGISGSATSIPRVQSVDINGSMNTQEVKEMGTANIVGYQSQVPTVEGTLTVLDTDVELIDLLTYGSINSGETEFQPGVVKSGGDMTLEIRLMDPEVTTASGKILKTVYIPDVEIQGDSYSVTVNDNASQEFRWRSATAQCLVYSGSRTA